MTKILQHIVTGLCLSALLAVVLLVVGAWWTK